MSDVKIVLKQDTIVSKVMLHNGVIYKTSPKYLSDNEEYFLNHVFNHTKRGMDYVPDVLRRVDHETIAMRYFERHDITDADKFMSHLPIVLDMLTEAGIRHGDLTKYAIIPHNNSPIIIDFAEARWMIDPIRPKRPEPDAVLLERAMRTLCTK